MTVTGNLFIALRNHLRGGPCRVYFADMKLNVQVDNAFYYPDVLVICAETDHAQSQYKSAPSLVVKVLSPSISAYDRGAKFASYRKLPSLREYVLIDPDRMAVDLFRKDAEGRWVLYPSEVGDVVEFASVNLTLPIKALYQDVELPEPQPGHGTPDFKQK